MTLTQGLIAKVKPEEKYKICYIANNPPRGKCCCIANIPMRIFISPLPVKPGDDRFPCRLSVRPSVCLSVCLSVYLSVSPLDVCPLGFLNFSRLSFEILT